ncbi:MAG: DNA/RNA nuclease SfsA [Thermoproteota archaeon]
MLFFPDAKTVRGRRQVRDLIEAKYEGYRTSVLFIIQRTDVEVLSPDDGVDPEFGDVLRLAVERGVEVYAYCSDFVGDKIILKKRVPVRL